MRLIDADALKQTFCAKCACVGCENCNVNFHFEHLAPTVDAELVKHGHWIEQDGYDGDVYYDCSVCGNSWITIDGTPQDNGMNYCPNCGANMSQSSKTECGRKEKTMRLIDADALIERAYRERLDSRELIAQMIESAPTVAVEEDYAAMKKELDYWYELAKTYVRTIVKLSTVLTKEMDK